MVKFLNEKRILWENICAKNLFVHFFVLPFNYGVKDLRKKMVQENVALVTGDVGVQSVVESRNWSSLLWCFY